MSTFEIIKTRKSVRTDQNKLVETDKIKMIVDAGNMAAENPMEGEVYFNVITNAEVLKGIVNGAKAAMANSGMEMLVKLSSNPSYDPIYGAPVPVVISATRTDVPNIAAMARANAACAGENMLLAATELGLGSCYLESPVLAFNIPEVAQAARLPENTQPQAMIVFGYTDDTDPHKEYPANPENIVYVD